MTVGTEEPLCVHWTEYLLHLVLFLGAGYFFPFLAAIVVREVYPRVYETLNKAKTLAFPSFGFIGAWILCYLCYGYVGFHVYWYGGRCCEVWFIMLSWVVGSFFLSVWPVAMFYGRWAYFNPAFLFIAILFVILLGVLTVIYVPDIVTIIIMLIVLVIAVLTFLWTIVIAYKNPKAYKSVTPKDIVRDLNRVGRGESSRDMIVTNMDSDYY